jgi:mannose-6-phosphate isomerase
MYPIHFEPIYQNYIWGGQQIAQKYQRSIKGRCSESWEIADRPEGMSVVANGIYKGRTLHDLMEELGEKLFGLGRAFERFPLLLKIIDAKESLSIQVHPSEKTADALGGEPKTEMWYALEPSLVYAGLPKGIDEEELLAAIKKNKAEELLERMELQTGDAILIPGGRIHAICGGSFLFEIQQNSNTTYRLYDWGRKGDDGKPRTLHLKEALAAIDWKDHKCAKIAHHHFESDLHHQLVNLISCPFFITLRADVFDHWQVPPTTHTFQVFFCLKGEGEIHVDGHKEPMRPGMTYLIPAASESISIEGKCEALWIRLP